MAVLFALLCADKLHKQGVNPVAALQLVLESTEGERERSREGREGGRERKKERQQCKEWERLKLDALGRGEKRGGEGKSHGNNIVRGEGGERKCIGGHTANR